MTTHRLLAVSAAVLVALVAGCQSEPEASFVAAKPVLELEPRLQQQIASILREQCGTPSALRLLGGAPSERARLKLGAAVYARQCRQCHGASGDGNGPSAAYMNPRPRDYRAGIFKFTSTTYGSKPLREDLVRTLRRGIAGTSMPAFRLLPQQDLEAVVDYVTALARRGELESQLAETALVDGEIDDKAVPEMVQTVVDKWRAARSQVVYPVAPMPDFTIENAKLGKTAFLSRGCSQCHGDDGRGQTAGNIGTDAWGRPTKAADLTSGMLRGGTEPLDLYRHVDAGINGTPMPSFHSALQQEPATTWNLVAYVLYLSNERRRGVVPEAGLLKPLPGVEAAATAAAAQPRHLARQ